MLARVSIACKSSVIAWLTLACYPSSSAAPIDEGLGAPIELFGEESEDESGSESGAPADLPACPHEGESPLTRLAFSVRTTAFGGQFKPRNVGAIWIERDDGTFVRTLERWGIMRAKWLERFNSASGGDVTDAITGPTLTSHGVHEVEWDLHDLSGCELPNGPLWLLVELTDRSGPGEWLAIPIEKGSEPGTTQPSDTAVFHDMVVRFE